ncbi:MAG TPA: M48 family metallopeptidase [Pyrinomonadaceae bacterium]|jgi:predicted Zn-dependent protease|nr:M48 family metallopeptidase [Pyrinomonadaceae bacterium]
MFSQLSRTFTALALALSLLGGSALAAPRAQDAQPQPAAKASQDGKDTKKVDKKAADEQAKRAAEAAKNAGKSLSTDEDPALIGKRKLNSGLFAKMSMSLEKEVALGRQVSAEIDRQAKLIDDPVITEYINRVGQNVVNHSDAKIPFTIKVVDSDEVNAFALPGGFFYVNKGLVLAADNEAEVAGVMAHEIAHVAARHYVETQAKGTVAQIGMIAGSIFLGGIPGMILQNTAGLGLAAGFSKFSRDAESEADKLGVQYLYAAGYDPGAMSTMFEKLASQNKKKPGFFAKTFASHPQSIDRLETSKALVARFPEHEEYILNTSEFQRVKNRLLRLSNSKASLAGDLASESTESGPARPTLKRRSPTPDADDSKPAEKKEAPPTLKKGTPPPPPPSEQR